MILVFRYGVFGFIMLLNTTLTIPKSILCMTFLDVLVVYYTDTDEEGSHHFSHAQAMAH